MTRPWPSAIGANMPVTLFMPALSPTMTEGAINRWEVVEGATVRAGDLIAEIETDKAAMEMEAVDEGVVARLLVASGEELIPVNSPIAILLLDGEDEKALDDYIPEAPPGPVGQAADPDAAAADATPEAAATPMSAPAAAPTPAAPAPSSGSSGKRTAASPLARRLAAAAGIDLSAVKGTGPRGRIVKSDIEAAEKSGVGAAAPAATEGDAVSPGVVIGIPVPDRGSLTIPLDGMRRTVASR